jgi:hypothetical protein
MSALYRPIGGTVRNWLDGSSGLNPDIPAAHTLVGPLSGPLLESILAAFQN